VHTAVSRPVRTRRSCTRACLPPVYTAVARPHGRSQPRTDRVHGRSRAVYAGRKHTRVQGTRPCRCTLYTAVDAPSTRPFHAGVHGPYTPLTAVYTVRTMPCTRAVKTAVFTVHGRVRAAYTAVIGSQTDHVRGPCTAVYTVCTRPWAAVYRLYTAALGRVQTVYTAVHGPCTWSVPVPNTAVYGAGTRQNTAGYAAGTDRVRTMYTAVHGPSMTQTRPCTRSCTLYTAVFTARVQYTARKRPCTADGHGRIYGPCTRSSTVYMHVFAARSRPCTDCVRAMYMVRS